MTNHFENVLKLICSILENEGGNLSVYFCLCDCVYKEKMDLKEETKNLVILCCGIVLLRRGKESFLLNWWSEYTSFNSFSRDYCVYYALGASDQGRSVRVKHDALMHHGQNRGSKTT